MSWISWISRIFFSSFYKSHFPVFTFSQMRKLEFRKLRDLQASISSILAYSKYENLDFKIQDFQTPVFSILARSQIRKLGLQKSKISKHPAEHPAFMIFVNIFKNTKTLIFPKVTIFGGCLILNVQASILFIFT